MEVISLEKFIEQTKGKVISFTDTDKLKGECVTLVQEYLRLCYNIPYKPRGNAKDWINTLPKEGIAEIVNTPKYGDIIVWGSNVGGGYGHVAIYIDNTKYYDQYVGKVANFATNSVNKPPIGYLRIKGNLIKKSIEEVAKDVIAGKYKNYPERKKLLEAEGYNYNEVQAKVNELLETELKVGDKVKIIKEGNGSSDGSANIAYGIGWTREILKIHKNKKYPYQVGNSSGTTGFYTKDALKKVI